MRRASTVVAVSGAVLLAAVAVGPVEAAGPTTPPRPLLPAPEAVEPRSTPPEPRADQLEPRPAPPERRGRAREDADLMPRAAPTRPAPVPMPEVTVPAPGPVVIPQEQAPADVLAPLDRPSRR